MQEENLKEKYNTEHMKNILMKWIVCLGIFCLFPFSSIAQLAKTDGLANVVRALAVMGTVIYVGTEDGIFKSTTNGANWIAVNSGLKSTIIMTLMVKGTTIFAGTMSGGASVSTDSGAHWKAINSGFPYLSEEWVFSFAAKGTNIYAGTSNEGVFISSNNGNNWHAMNSGLTNKAISCLVVKDNDILAGTNGGVFILTNSDTVWTSVNSGLTDLGVDRLVICGTSIFAGTFNGGIFRSTNNGASWISVNPELTYIPSRSEVSAFAVMGTNIFAGTEEKGVFLSTDNGTTWTQVNSGLPFYQTGLIWYDISCFAVIGTNILAGTGDGVFLSADTGKSWTPFFQGLPVKNPRNHCSEQLAFKISPPSRVNPNINIGFSLPRPEHIKIQINNLSGRQIISLINEKLGAGAHKYTWSTQSITPGCYVVRLQTETSVHSKTFPLIR